MKPILLFILVYSSVLFMSNSQETISPYYKGGFECATIDDFILSNDIFTMDGEVVKLKTRTALAHIVSDEMQRHNLLNTEKFALDYVLVFYPVLYVNHNNEAIIGGKEAVIYFANTNGCFDNKPSQSDRFYKMLYEGADETTMKKLERWAKESGIQTSFQVEDPLLWHWFYEEVEYKIAISCDVVGNKKAVLTRELPQYFFINYKDE